MKSSSNILYVGLDVDDNAFHGCGLCSLTGEVYEFKCKPTLASLLNSLNNLQSRGYELQVCYEATYLGYNLCRKLIATGIHCEIIAPSLIPETSGSRVKTDRTDAAKLARLYSKGLLTPIHIPDEKDEAVRDMIRSRSFLVDQRSDLKRHILSTCRRHSISYREECGAKSNYWTKKHIEWLIDKVNSLPGVTRKIFEVLLYELTKLDECIEELMSEIESASDDERYRARRDILNCFRGLDTLTSMTIITEIGDIKRFKHPRQLVSYSGLDIAEYSSGGKERKLGITKMGNKRIRTTLVEACQTVMSPFVLSKRLRRCRDGMGKDVVDIADRCMKRLHKKACNMHIKGKHINKIKTACAREYLGFIWEALRLVS